jgi:two-component system response regulator BaeR
MVLDQSHFQATLDGHDLGLTAVEFKLLQFLFSKPGQICTRPQLMGSIYPDKRVVADRTIDSHIKKLRKKIAMISPNMDFIHSVYGVGYKLDPR